jgi:hypothetical protein
MPLSIGARPLSIGAGLSTIATEGQLSLLSLLGGRLPPRSGRAHLTERPPAKRAGTGSKFRYAPDPRAREEYARRALRDKEREELSLKDAAKS